MIINKKNIALWIVLWSVCWVRVSYAALSPEQILTQAERGNLRFFQAAQRYPNLIDMTDKNGDTAYCLALKSRNFDAQRVLYSYGANPRHECVKKLYTRTEKQTTSTQRVTHTASVQAAEGANYALWGLGVVAAGGAVAVAASSGGGGGGGSDDTASSSSTESGSSGNGNGNSSSENGNSGGSSSTTLSAAYFKTDEYKKGNFLSAINAAEAYSSMYRLNENGNLVSHQANSDEPLAKVKVGVLDTGVYPNKDLDGKIVSAYNLNEYQGKGNIFLTQKDGVYTAMIYRNGAYNLVQWTEDNNVIYISGQANGITEEKLAETLAAYKLTKSDFSVVNAAGDGMPGTDDTYYNISCSKGDSKCQTLYSLVSELNHGTHIAGIIAGNKDDSGIHGVAFENAQIVAASWDLSVDKDVLNAVTSMVDKDVKVINNSWGLTASNSLSAENTQNYLTLHESDVLKAYAYAAANDAVWVQATGNNGYSQPDVHSSMPQMDLSAYGYSGAGEYEAPFIAVTALGEDGKIASYANRCGVAGDYCLAAPGSNVASTAAMSDGDITMSGTSMATPVVSGSIALLKGYYPWLKAQNISYLLLATANNKGDYADSAIYGKGVLDLEAAVTTPIDGLSLSNDGTFENMQSVTSTGKVYAGGVLQNSVSAAMPKTVTAFDALNRPFEYATENMVDTTHQSSARMKNEVARMALAAPKQEIVDAKTGFAFSSHESMNKTGVAKLSDVDVVKNNVDGGNTRFYYAEKSAYSTSDNVLKKTANPYFAMNEAYGAENTLALSPSSKLKFSLQTGENGLYERDEDQDRHSFDERAYAFGAEYEYALTDYLTLATMGGMLYENDAMLGLNGSGLFDMNDSSTYYVGLRAALNLTDNLSLLAAYYRGYTTGSETTMLDIGNLETESFMLAGEYKTGKNSKVGLSFASPLSVVKGQAKFRYATGRDNYSDTVYMNELKTSLKPEAKEYDFGLYYQGQAAENLSLGGKVETRLNADGEKGVTDYMGILGAQYRF
jgi:hypothetical protein